MTVTRAMRTSKFCLLDLGPQLFSLHASRPVDAAEFTPYRWPYGNKEGRKISAAVLLRLAPLIFVILWATGFIGSKLGASYAEPFTFLSVHFLIVVPVMSSGAYSECVKVHHLIGKRNIAVTYSHTFKGGEDYAFFDIFRFKVGEIVEHWDEPEKIAPHDKWNNSGKFERATTKANVPSWPIADDHSTAF